MSNYWQERQPGAHRCGGYLAWNVLRENQRRTCRKPRGNSRWRLTNSQTIMWWFHGTRCYAHSWFTAKHQKLLFSFAPLMSSPGKSRPLGQEALARISERHRSSSNLGDNAWKRWQRSALEITRMLLPCWGRIISFFMVRWKILAHKVRGAALNTAELFEDTFGIRLIRSGRNDSARRPNVAEPAAAAVACHLGRENQWAALGKCAWPKLHRH